MFSFFFLLCRYISGFNVTLEYGFDYLARYPLLVLTGCSELLIPINKRLTSKTFKIAKTSAKLAKHHPPFNFSSVNVERAYKNKNRKGFIDRQRMGSLWGKTHTI